MKKYVHRAIETEIQAAAKEFPVVTLTGPRQTGKSTLLQKLFPRHEYVTLDDPITRKIAQEDPSFFVSRSKRMILDEIQQWPEILAYVKMAVDRQREINGRYIVTSSQCFPMMAGLSETLAGRTALYELLGFSSEELPRSVWRGPRPVFSALFNGFFPEIAVHKADRKRFYTAYLQTYLERDIRQITSVHDLKIFQNFLELLASRAGGLLNLNELAKDCGISFASARRWLSLLENTRIVYLLRPYTRNITKRVVKALKIYFTDTGLLTFLLRYPDPETLRSGPHSGALFENLIIGEFLKYKNNHNANFELYFFRDSNQKEVDLIVDMGNTLKLIEIKATATPRAETFLDLKKAVSFFPHAEGFLLSFFEKREHVFENVTSLPLQDMLTILSPVKRKKAVGRKQGGN